MRKIECGALWGLVPLLLGSLWGCQGQVGHAGGEGTPGVVVDDNGKRLGAADILISDARRLSREEVDRAIGALLFTNQTYGSNFLPEDNHEREGLFLHWAFDNRFTHQPTDKVLVQAYEALALAAAQDLVGDTTRLSQVLPCDPSGASDRACFEEFVRDFGRRAFRRALSEDEVARFAGLLSVAEADSDFNAAVDLAVRAFLQSPDFLYRVEIGTPVASIPSVSRLSGPEVATRMAFFLWGTGPGHDLLDQADLGLLESSEQRRDVAALMLEEPEALDQIERFHALWLGFRQLPHSIELTTSMRLETRALLERVIFEDDSPYMDVFQSNETFIDSRLAEHYDMELSGTESAFVDYADPARGGILSHGSVMGAFSTGGDTSTTRRGVFVRERLMCQIIPPPPANVNADDLPETNCKSELLEVHQMGACGSCHTLMDPVGWGLENFNLAGQFRAHDEGKPECEIDGAGQLDGARFTGPRELAEILISDGSLEACAVRQVLRFAMGREETSEDETFIEEMTTGRIGTDWTFRELLLDIVASERFVHVRPSVEGE